jgi:hypothetical protein
VGGAAKGSNRRVAPRGCRSGGADEPKPNVPAKAEADSPFSGVSPGKSIPEKPGIGAKPGTFSIDYRTKER